MFDFQRKTMYILCAFYTQIKFVYNNFQLLSINKNDVLDICITYTNSILFYMGMFTICVQHTRK